MKPQFCYAFIVDEMNYKILTPKLFLSLTDRPWFVVKVRESEDLLSPNYKTVKALQQIKRSMCDVHVVLISNGIQVERFIRFGDKHQEALDIRAKFLMMHDYRLFAPSMLYIWRKLINVVFIKKTRDNRGFRYELTTVPFPIQIRDIYIEYQVDMWRNGRFRFGRPLFYDKTSNLEGQELRAVVIEHTPAVKKVNETSYSGLEVKILSAISEALNFTIELFETSDSDTEKWGKIQPNSSWTGLIAEMVEGTTDFGLGDLHYTEYHLKLMDLSIPYLTECLTFITPEFVSDNSWKTLILPFSPDMWLGVCISLLCVGMVFFVFSKFYSFAINKNDPKANAYQPEKMSFKAKIRGMLVRYNTKNMPIVEEAPIFYKVSIFSIFALNYPLFNFILWFC